MQMQEIRACVCDTLMYWMNFQPNKLTDLNAEKRPFNENK